MSAGRLPGESVVKTVSRVYLILVAALWAAPGLAQRAVNAQGAVGGQSRVQAHVSLDASRHPLFGQSAFSNVFGDIGSVREYTVSNINVDGRGGWLYPCGWTYSNFSYVWQYQRVWIPGYYIERWIPPVIGWALVRGTAQTRVIQPGYYERQWVPGHYELQARPVLVPYTIPFIRFQPGWNAPFLFSQQGAAIQHNARPGPGSPGVDSREGAASRPAVNAQALSLVPSQAASRSLGGAAAPRSAFTAAAQPAVIPADGAARFAGVLRR